MTATAVGCGKKSYPTRRDARAALDACRRQAITHTRRRERTTYRCPFCDAWHLTHLPPKPRKKAHR